MTTMQIRIKHSSDWGVDHTPDDVAAYEADVTERVLAVYPGADVEITEHLGSILVRVYDCPETEEEGVIATVKSIAQQVWDDAAFWPAEVAT